MFLQVIAKGLAQLKWHKEMEEKLSSGVKDWSRGVFEKGVSARVVHWGRGRKAGAWGGGKGAGFSLVRSEGCQTSSEKCYQRGSGSKYYPGNKSMRWVNCESEKGQASGVEKKGDISEALKFAWQKARPSGCQVRGTSSVSSKEDSSRETFTANPDGVAHNSLLNLYVERMRRWSG